MCVCGGSCLILAAHLFLNQMCEILVIAGPKESVLQVPEIIKVLFLGEKQD